MTDQIAIYLAGSIQKDHAKDSCFYWSESECAIIRKTLSPLEVYYLNPAKRCDDLSDQQSVFGRDLLQIFCSDFVFVDAREKRGLGVGSEMMWAKVNSIPLVTLAPKNTHYHKEEATLLGVTVSNWVHPFVESLSDVVVESVEEGALWMRHFLANPIKVKNLESVHACMRHYQHKELARDLPMKDLLHSCQHLVSRIHKSQATL